MLSATSVTMRYDQEWKQELKNMNYFPNHENIC